MKPQRQFCFAQCPEPYALHFCVRKANHDGPCSAIVCGKGRSGRRARWDDTLPRDQQQITFNWDAEPTCPRCITRAKRVRFVE